MVMGLATVTGMISREQLGELLSAPGQQRLVWSEEQFAAIDAGMHPHLVVAGAGSGKTTVMTARIIWLVAHGHVQPGEVLGLTFTNKAAGEFSERLAAALMRLGRMTRAARTFADEDEQATPLIATYHSFAQRLLGEHGLRIGYEPGATLLNEVTRQQLAYRTVQRTSSMPSALKTYLPTVVSQLLSLEDLVSERLIEPSSLADCDGELIEWLDVLPTLQNAGETMRETAARRRELVQLVTEFREAKRRHFVVDFADQMRNAATLAGYLAQHEPVVIAQLQLQYQAVLLDEYQDTSVAQRRMLQALFGGGHPIMAVGDPCQAIYGWRGASVFNMDEFTRDFPQTDGSDATHSSLTVVRRCAAEILDVANRISDGLRQQHPLVQPLAPDVPARYSGRFEVARQLTVDAETDWVVEKISHATTEFEPKEVAVLCRRGADIARIARALDRAGIAYDVVGVTGLLGRPEVADLLSVLHLLNNPADNPSLVRLLSGRRWAVGVRDLAALGRYARALNPRYQHAQDARIAERLADSVREQDPADVMALCDVLEDIAQGVTIDGLSDEAADRCRLLVTELRYLRRFLGEPIEDLINRILTVSGAEVEIRIGSEPLVATRVQALECFSELAADYRGLDGDRSLTGFLQWLTDAQKFDKAPSVDVPSSGDHLRLMTVHGSKGLEFDAVVLPYLVKDIFPTRRGRPRWPSSPIALPPSLLELREQPHVYPEYPNRDKGPTATDLKKFGAHMQTIDRIEETRLAYVAVTRARKLVVASGHLWGPTQKDPREVSPWLATMHEYLETGGVGTIDSWQDDAADGEARPEIQPARFTWPESIDDGAATALAQAAQVGHNAMQDGLPQPRQDVDDSYDVAAWRTDVDTLLSEWDNSQNRLREVQLPTSLSATAVMKLAKDPAEFARELARPMPLVSTRPAARGTEFHLYVENKWRGELALFPRSDVDELFEDVTTNADVSALIESFEAGPFATRIPFDVEVPFTLVLPHLSIRGRIDAIYQCPDGTWEIIDWKTSRDESADPLQLAVYRQAWARMNELRPEAVRAGFHYVRSGNTDMHGEDLAGYDELVALMDVELSP